MIGAEGLPKVRQKEEWIDVAKGIGILFVIIGHLVQLNAVLAELTAIGWSFHMPLFFFIGGYLFKKKPLDICIQKCMRNYIFPYFVTLLIQCIFLGIRILVRNEEDFLTAFLYYFDIAMKGNGYTVWFLPAYAISVFIFNAICDKKLCGLYVIIFFAIGYLSYKVYVMPYSIQNGMTAMVFMYVGFLAKKYGIFEKAFKRTLLSVVMFIAALGIWYLCKIRMCSSIILVYNTYGQYIVPSIVYALSAIVCCLCISRVISSFLRHISKPFRYIGQNSLIAMCFHSVENHFLPYAWSSFFTGISVDISSVLILFLKIMWAFAAVFIVNRIPFLRRCYGMQ